MATKKTTKKTTKKAAKKTASYNKGPQQKDPVTNNHVSESCNLRTPTDAYAFQSGYDSGARDGYQKGYHEATMNNPYLKLLKLKDERAHIDREILNLSARRDQIDIEAESLTVLIKGNIQ